jgi:CMD domain protein
MTAAVTDAPDVIDLLVGVSPGAPLDAIRAERPQARQNAQASFLALFQPADEGDATRAERYAVATFVAGLHRQPDLVAFYAKGLADADQERLIAAEIARAVTHGPYGHYPAGPLSAEDQPGLAFLVSEASRPALGPRLSAAFAHAHLLVFHPRDSAPEALQGLLDAGWSATGIVTLSQLVSFLAFQIRVVAGLRTLAATLAGGA